MTKLTKQTYVPTIIFNLFCGAGGVSVNRADIHAQSMSVDDAVKLLEQEIENDKSLGCREYGEGSQATFINKEANEASLGNWQKATKTIIDQLPSIFPEEMDKFPIHLLELSQYKLKKEYDLWCEHGKKDVYDPSYHSFSTEPYIEYVPKHKYSEKDYEVTKVQNAMAELKRRILINIHSNKVRKARVFENLIQQKEKADQELIKTYHIALSAATDKDVVKDFGSDPLNSDSVLEAMQKACGKSMDTFCKNSRDLYMKTIRKVNDQRWSKQKHGASILSHSWQDLVM